MAGYTESPFRSLVKAIEPSIILVSELVSAECLRLGSKKSFAMLRFKPEEKTYFGIQLFGKTLESFVAAAKIVEDLGADFIDLNLGCPSPKVSRSGHGSALLKDGDGTARLIEALVKSVKLPITVKMRLGFYDDSELMDNAKKFELAGISLLSIHGRTALQKFSGMADWSRIYEVKNNLGIPVIGNGDIESAADAVERLRNLDGVMIGRASVDNPWIFKQCRQLLDRKPPCPDPTLEEHLNFLLRQARLEMESKTEEWSLVEMRKLLVRLAKRRGVPKEIYRRLAMVGSYALLEGLFDEILNWSSSNNPTGAVKSLPVAFPSSSDASCGSGL